MVIGYLSGVFDLFHVGHLNIIQRSKELCDYLIVGVSTDELCASYKGHNPTIPFEERKKIVSAIKYVDEVISQETLEKKTVVEKYGIKKIFHGDDIQNRELYKEIERSVRCYGTEVILLPYTPNISSTQLNMKKTNNCINYRSLNDMDYLVKTNCHKIPEKIDFIVGVPKSGLFVATILATQLNIPILSYEVIVLKQEIKLKVNKKNWKKATEYEPNGKYHILLVDDSVNNGEAIETINREIYEANPNLIISTLAVYATKHAAAKTVDMWFELLEQPRVFEWNLHHNNILEKTIIQGSLLMQILERFNGYGLFLKRIGLIYNDSKLSDEELDILLRKVHIEGVVCGNERTFADVYGERESIIFSIVDNDYEAMKISRETGKPVLAYYSSRCFQ